ncbi:peptidoglycan DD-metalloendopeptidase family protein [Streptomyces sp. NPDC051104]|uniref:M23 family metallopeptidase n=1 Tax=Streptomyces sp. NPDC051104 TaxID=3155044 RepID=UPI00343D0B77
MPAKGKHRRPKPRRFTRSLAVAGTGGAAFALPLVGAAGAHAATPASSVAEKAAIASQETVTASQGTAIATEKAATAVPVTVKRGADRATGSRTYTVEAGDWLEKIAREQHVDGGWHRLYEDNRSAVGSDPSLIHPGLKLTLDGARAATRTTTPPAAKSKASRAVTRKAARTATVSAGFTLPVTGAVLGTGYHVAGGMWSSGHHTGVDFVVPTGTSVKAVTEGTVVAAGWGGAYGNQVVIRLADGRYAQYAHLSHISVAAGQTVAEGQQVGRSGATGNVTGPHLHFEIRTTPDYGSDVDPVAYLRSHGVTVG